MRGLNFYLYLAGRRYSPPSLRRGCQGRPRGELGIHQFHSISGDEMGSSNEVLLPLLARKISVGTSREPESPNPPHCNREGLPSTSDVCGDWAGNFYPMWQLIRQYSPFPLLEWYHSKPTKTDCLNKTQHLLT